MFHSSRMFINQCILSLFCLPIPHSAFNVGVAIKRSKCSKLLKKTTSCCHSYPLTLHFSYSFHDSPFRDALHTVKNYSNNEPDKHTNYLSLNCC